MQMQFGHILAGLARRTRKPEHQRLVDEILTDRIPNADERGPASAWQAAGHQPQGVARARSTDPHNRDACGRTSRRQGEDRIRVHLGLYRKASLAHVRALAERLVRRWMLQP